jgi:hypothetical protein
MNMISKHSAAIALSAILLATIANNATACGGYGPPPMTQTLHAALSGDARVASGAFVKLLNEGKRGLWQVEEQQRWLPMQTRRLGWQITNLENLLKAGQPNLTDVQKAKHAVRLAELRLERARIDIRRAALDSLARRLRRAISISLVVT